jgi:hypothetical protein
VGGLGVERRLKQEQVALKGMNEEQTASLKTALLHAARDAPVVRAQMRTAQRGSIPIAWASTNRATTRLLPTRAVSERRSPLRDRVTAFVGRHHRRLRPLDEQAAQVGVAALGDAIRG